MNMQGNDTKTGTVVQLQVGFANRLFILQSANCCRGTARRGPNPIRPENQQHLFIILHRIVDALGTKSTWILSVNSSRLPLSAAPYKRPRSTGKTFL
jgi:hypothetical protein